MKSKLLFLLALVFACISCGGDSGSSGSITVDGQEVDCVEISHISNGPNDTEPDSYWNCTSSTGTYMLYFFEDGTGYSSAIGYFTWDDTSCNEFTCDSAYGEFVVDDLSGSVDSGVFTFDQTYDGSSSVISTSCVLVD